MIINQDTTAIDFFLGSLKRLLPLGLGVWVLISPAPGRTQPLLLIPEVQQTIELGSKNLLLWIAFAGFLLFILVFLGVLFNNKKRKKDKLLVCPPFIMDIPSESLFEVEPFAMRESPVAPVAPPSIDRLPAQLRALIDKMPTPAWTRTADGHLIFVNEAYTRAVGKSFLEVLEQQIEIVTLAVAVQNQATPSMAQRYTLIMEGQPKLFEISEMPLEGNAGMVGFARDVSVVSALEHDIEYQNTLYQSILDRMDTAVALFDTKRRLVFYNNALATMWGLSPDVLEDEALTVEKIFEHKQKQQPFLEANNYDRFLLSQKQLFRSLVEEKKTILEFLDGRVFEVTIVPQKAGGLLYCYHDISEQNRNKKAVEVAYTAAQYAGNILGIGLLWLNAAHQSVRWNDKVFDIFNFSKDSAGEALWQKIINSLKEDEAKKLKQTLSLDNNDTILVNLDNNRTIKTKAYFLENKEILLVFEDTSHQDALELKYRQNIAQYSTFLQKYCRELLDMGDAIAAFSTLTQHSNVPQNKRHDYITFMHNATVQLQTTLQTTLKLITAQTRKTVLNLSDTQLLPSLRNVVAVLDKDAKARGIKLELSPSFDLGSIVLDEEKFRQAMEQLLLFLMRHTAEGGVITVRGQRDAQGVCLVFEATHALVPLALSALFAQEGNFLDYGEYLHHFGVLLAVEDLRSHGATVHFTDNPPFETRIECRFDVLS